MWNTIIRGFSQSSVTQYAILLFIDMLTDSPSEPQRLTYLSLFKAYTQLGLSKYGAQLHRRIVKLALEIDPFIRNTIIHMYANSGFLSEAYKLFDEGGDFNAVAWNSLIMGLAKAREINEAKRLFDEMGLRRNAISWNSIISGYVMNDKFIEAMKLFERMQEEGGQSKGQAGLLTEAEQLIGEMPMDPDAIIWGSLLSSCRKHGNIEMDTGWKTY